MLLGIAGAAFVGIFFFALPFPLIVVAAALVGFLVAQLVAGAARVSRPTSARCRARARPLAAGRDRDGRSGWWPGGRRSRLSRSRSARAMCWQASALFFSKLAVVSFGGAYALLAYMAQEAVETHGWMTAPEMVDGLGLAETTPGPLILVTQFVGFLAAFRDAAPFSPVAAGMLGAAMTTWVTFVPSMLWIFAGAPFVEQLRANRRLSGALAAITAAVVGVILNLSVWFALHVLFGQVDGACIRPAALVCLRSAGARSQDGGARRDRGGAGLRLPPRPDRDRRDHGRARDRGAAHARRVS